MKLVMSDVESKVEAWKLLLPSLTLPQNSAKVTLILPRFSPTRVWGTALLSLTVRSYGVC